MTTLTHLGSRLVATLATALLIMACAARSVPPATPAPIAAAPVTVATAPTVPPVTPTPPALVFPADQFRKAQPPPSGPPRTLKLPPIARFKLANGVDVYLVEDHALPKVELTLDFDGGSLTDPPGKEGRAAVCAAIMNDGTATLDKVALATAKADLAAHVSVGVTSDQHTVTLSTLTRNLDAAGLLWADVLLHPGFRQADFERNLQLAETGLKQAKATPAGLGAMYLPRILYGAGHPLARMSTQASLARLTIADCQAFHRETWKPVGARLWVAGDITRAQIEALSARVLAGWSGTARAVAKVSPARPQPGRVYFIDVPGAAQSQVYVMELGPSRQDPGYFANSLLGAILGGSFSSRINMLARETKGYTYGARATFQYQRTFGTLVASGSIRTDATAEAVTDFIGEIAKLASTGEITDEELHREQDGLILRLPAQFETAGNVLSSLARLVYFGLPLDYYDSYVARAQAIDKQAIAAAAKRWLKPASLIVFVVGDAKIVRADLEHLLATDKLGKGAFVTLDTEGQVMRPSPTK